MSGLCILQRYEEPTVLLAKRVTGEEEVPEGCVAVLTPDAPDVLSHVSVRARNMRVLFAICHEEEPLREVEKLAGQVRHLPPSLPARHMRLIIAPLAWPRMSAVAATLLPIVRRWI
jgi:hypothetical protein